ncbi:MAG: thiol peroxidase [Candidatus Ratteibacteria bacterium]
MKKIRFKDKELTLVGITLSKIAPNFRVISQNMELVKLSDFKDKIKVITSFPSLDTPVCDLQVNEFNKLATSLSEKVIVIGISCDLPFAQKRFCLQNEIKNVYIFSDYMFHSFGINFCLFIKELGLLARTIFILDEENNVRYFEIVPELSLQPNYVKALEALNKIEKGIEKEWEEIRCCKWVNENGKFKLRFNIQTDEELRVLLKILTLIKEERNINFKFQFSESVLEVFLSSEEFNVEVGSVFERIIY